MRVTPAVNRPKIVFWLASGDCRIGATWFCDAPRASPMVGKSVARWALALSWATLSDAAAAWMSGLARSAASIRLLSWGDWKTPHH